MIIVQYARNSIMMVLHLLVVNQGRVKNVGFSSLLTIEIQRIAKRQLYFSHVSCIPQPFCSLCSQKHAFLHLQIVGNCLSGGFYEFPTVLGHGDGNADRIDSLLMSLLIARFVRRVAYCKFACKHLCLSALSVLKSYSFLRRPSHLYSLTVPSVYLNIKIRNWTNILAHFLNRCRKNVGLVFAVLTPKEDSAAKLLQRISHVQVCTVCWFSDWLQSIA